MPRGRRHRFVFLGLPQPRCNVRRVHGVVADADGLALRKAVCVRPVDGTGETHELGKVACRGEDFRVLSAARIDLTALFIQLAAPDVFFPVAARNGLEAIARWRRRLSQFTWDRATICVN